MKTLYLECGMGASGDMLMGALLELAPDADAFLRRVNAVGLPDVEVSRAAAEQCHIRGSRVFVRIRGAEEGEREHARRGMGEIADIVRGLAVSDRVKADALAVYGLIARAESQAHGVPVKEIHFHEVGALDAICDVTGVCMLIEALAPEKILASPVTTGYGSVRHAHGALPVPTPATALLLRGIPARRGEYEGELLTPTGAALLKYFVDAFGADPVFTADAVGCGMGKREFPAPNCVRAFLGKTKGGDEIAELKCNLDDVTPEAVGYAQRALLEDGALDVFTAPIYMKKNRPAVLLTCLCRVRDAERLAAAMLRHTTTAGVRRTDCRRYTLETESFSVRTAYGTVRVKKYTGGGVRRVKPEYDDVAALARNADATFDEVYRAAAEEGARHAP